MKTMKNKSVKLFATMLILLVGIIITLAFPNDNNSSAFAMDGGAVYSEKVYSRTTIDENFDGTSVMVVLDRAISSINKGHSTNLFGSIEIVEVLELSTVSSSARSIVDESNWEQVLQIKLPQDSKENVLRVISQLERIDGIKYAGPNRYLEIEKTTNDPFYMHATDKEWGQWGLEKIQAPLAWDITTGNNNVRVGIIDTGIGNLVEGQPNHPDLNANLVAGGDFVNMTSILDNIPGAIRADTNGHGTHVAGIVGAVGNNSVGVSGVNWNVSLVPMQVATGGVIDSAACVRAVNFARDTWNTPQRISVLNFSIGGGSVWPEIETAIRQYPGLFVCSTGNANQNNDITRHYPSFYGSALHTNPLVNMISVGRSDIKDERPTGTGINANWGAQTITLFAPGHNILSTYPVNLTSNFGTGYHRTSGSSMATPMVSGVAALLLSVNPALTTSQLKAAIVNNVTPVTALNGLCVTGGRLNASKALQSLSFNTRAFDNFGYNGSTYYWNGKVDMTVANGSLVDQISSNTMTLSGDTMLDFKLSTASSKNSWSTINGTVSFQLTLESTGTVIKIQGNDTHVSTVNVNVFNNVTLENAAFRINTADFSLPGTHTYTLTLTSDLDRASWNDTDTKTFNIVIENPPLCVAEGSLITLADGSQVAVEGLTGDEELLVWNMMTGEFDSAPILFIDSDPYSEYEITHLYFSDDTEVKVIDEHGFWDFDLNRYVFLRNDAAQYIGHWFNKQTVGENGNMTWTAVQLIDVDVYKEYTTAWSPVTFGYLCYYVNGMLTMPGATTGFINIFEVDPVTMQYDMDAMLADIEEYGFFTYDEFVELIPIPEIIFEAFNGQYLKVAIGKGLITIDEIGALIERYACFFAE